MIGYITLGSNSVQETAKFYDALFQEMGIQRVYDQTEFVAWGANLDAPLFCITTPYNKAPATAGNGVMIAVQVADTATVDRIHAKALQLGAVDEGAPGGRYGSYYCGYFRDPDGNKLNFYCRQTITPP